MQIVVTAIGKPELHEELKQLKEIQIIGKDIQYPEGILEIIEKENNIQFIILSEIIFGELEIKKYIQKIKKINSKIKIIILLKNKKIELEKELKKIGIFKIIYFNQFNKIELLKIIEKKEKKENKKSIEELEKEIQTLHHIIEKNKIQKQHSIISILGTGGIGKSVCISNLAKILPVEKILIIDLDILNSSIALLFNIKNNTNHLEKNPFLKKDKIENYIIKINKKIDILLGKNIVCNTHIQNKKIENLILELAEKYDVIFIDTTLECFLGQHKKIIQMSSDAIMLIEGNVLEIQKAKNILQIYVQEWNIPMKNIQIIINKYTKNSIDKDIIKNIFKEHTCIGILQYYTDYQMVTEKNIVLNLKIKKEYQKISDYILKKIGKDKPHARTYFKKRKQHPTG